MASLNHFELRGVVNVRKAYPERDGKKALCFASIKPDAKGPFFDLIAFGQAACDLGNAHELVATVSGRIGHDKPKDTTGEKKPWPLSLVVEKVLEHAPEAPEGLAHPEGEDPF